MRALAASTLARLGAVLALSLALPARAEDETPAPPPVLKGFNLSADVWAVSGVDRAQDAFESQATLYLQPTYALGKQHFRGTWFEGVSLSGRLLLTQEFTGNDPTFRTAHLQSLAAVSDEHQPLVPPSTPSDVPSSIDGATRQMDVSDLWLGAFQDKVAVIPRLDAKVQAGLRVVVPISLLSRNTGLVTAPSLYVGLARKIGPVELSAGTRASYSFYAKALVPVPHSDETVDVNGQAQPTYDPRTSGARVPWWALASTLSATWELPHDVALGVVYTLFNTHLRPFGSCAVEGVPAADLCSDTRAVTGQADVNQRDSGWFLASVDWKFNSFATVGLGLSTFRPVRNPDGSIGNPFWKVSRDNLTTAYLSFGLDAEGVAQAWKEKQK